MFQEIILLLVACHMTVAIKFEFQNDLPREVWVGCQGNPGYPHLNEGGWVMQPGEGMTVFAQDDWAGRFWGRSWCDPNTNHCQTGDCGNRLQCMGAGGNPPASLAEITLNGWRGGMDYYDISLVDGFNVEIAIEPLGGQGDGSPYICTRAACLHRILADCPVELQLKGDVGQVVGCNSACNAFNTDQYCCRGAHDKPEACNSTDWPVNYPKFFKDSCPDAHSYAYDDHKITFECMAPAYSITFGV